MANSPINNDDIISEIISNKGNRFSIHIFIKSESYLEIEIKPKDNISNILYDNEFTLDKIKKISKYFFICESIIDVICSIKPLINNARLIEKNDEIDLIISINHPLCKEALFTIPNKKKEIYYSIKEIYELVNNLKNNINYQQETINKQQNEIIELKKRIHLLENRMDESIKDENNGLNDSLILLNDKKYKLSIKKWIDKNKKIKFNLLFRKSRDGSNCSIFHNKCDNQGNTLCLFQTSKNYKFGGYTSISWKNSYKISNDNEGYVFLFSLDLNQKFEKIKEGNVQYSSYNYGPCFGDGGGCLYLEENLNYGFIDNKNFLTNYELTHGENGNFEVEEFEVFKVEIS